MFRDLETLPSPPDDPIPALIQDLRISFIEEFRKQGLRTDELRVLIDTPGLDDFRRALQVLMRDARAKRTRVLLALDETEFLMLGDIRDESRGIVAQFLASLRSLVQENDNFCVVLSGLTSQVIELGRLFGRPNPLYSWATPHFVGPLGRLDADDLIVSLGKRMAMTWSEAALAALYARSDGHPFLHRTLASSAFNALSVDERLREITEKEVQAVDVQWRRDIGPRIREVFETLELYYPDERTLIDICRTDPSELD